MAEGKKIPVVRFKGFSAEWDTCRLDEAASVERGKFSARPRNDPRYFEGNIPFVQTGDVGSASRRLRRFSQTLNEEGLAVSKSFPENTIIMTIAANIGDLTITDFSVACPDSVVAINANDDFDTGFLFDFLGIKKGDLEAVATTNAQANINLKILNPLKVVAPTLCEQTRIATYFQKLDEMIGLHQRKHEKLVTLKKAMLTKMFPQNGATSPEIRFKGFSKPWEEKQFDEIVFRVSSINMGSNLPRVEYEDIVPNSGKLNKNIFKKTSFKNGIQFDVGDVLFGKLRPYLKNWLLAGFKGVAVGDFWVLRPIEADANFLYNLIQTSAFYFVANQSAGSKMPRSDWKLVSRSFFQLPVEIDEQQKIGTYFRQLDELITQHNTQIKKLKRIKTACLEKMFV